MVLGISERRQRSALLAFHQHADIAVRQLEHLHDAGDDAHIVERLTIGIVFARVKLGNEEDVLVARHGLFERGDTLVATHEQGHDHLRKNDDVPQRQEGQIKIHYHSNLSQGTSPLRLRTAPI